MIYQGVHTLHTLQMQLIGLCPVGAPDVTRLQKAVEKRAKEVRRNTLKLDFQPPPSKSTVRPPS
jgi:hypothetical protein